MNIQEQEENTYMPNSELEMCLEEAKLYIPENANPIGEGDFILQQKSVYYCKSTDATVGSYISYAKRFKTQEEAEIERQKKINTEGYDYYEDHIQILDKNGEDINLIKLKEKEHISNNENECLF